MCISTIPLRNRSACQEGAVNVDGQEFFTSYWSWMNGYHENNCTHNDTVTVMVTEVDTINNVHAVQLNMTEDLWALDLSQFDFPNIVWYVKPTSEIIAKTAIFAPIVIGGIILNLVILTTLWKNRWLWTPSNYLIANMAFVDLITLILCPWMLLLHLFYQNYMLGKVGCKLEGFLQGAFLITGVASVVAVSYDRLAAVVLPSDARVTRRGAAWLIAAAWLLGFLFALPLSIYRQYRERVWRDFVETYCSEDVTFLPAYWHVLVAALVWLPLACVSTAYAAIFWRLDRYAQHVARRCGGSTAARAHASAARVAAAVLLAFMACRLPFTVLVYWRSKLQKNAQINGVEGSFQVMWFVAHCLIYLNCAINPLIYGFSNPRYRRAMSRTPFFSALQCSDPRMCCCCSRPDNKKGLDSTDEKKATSKEELIFGYQSPPAGKRFMQIFQKVLGRDHTIPGSTPTTEILPHSSKITPLSPEHI